MGGLGRRAVHGPTTSALARAGWSAAQCDDRGSHSEVAHDKPITHKSPAKLSGRNATHKLNESQQAQTWHASQAVGAVLVVHCALCVGCVGGVGWGGVGGRVEGWGGRRRGAWCVVRGAGWVGVGWGGVMLRAARGAGRGAVRGDAGRVVVRGACCVLRVVCCVLCVVCCVFV